MRVVLTAVLVTALMLLAGCGRPSAPEPPPSDQWSVATSVSADPGTAPSTADPSQGTDPSRLGEPFARRTSSLRGGRVEAVIYPVVRRGRTSSVNLVLSSTFAPAERRDVLRINDMLADSDLSAGDALTDTADGLRLVDGVHGQVYLVATDGEGHCLCSTGLALVTLERGEPVVVSATFAAPPADVSTLELRIPHFGTMSDVPVV